GTRGCSAGPPGPLDRHVEPPHDQSEQRRVGTAAERGVEVDQVDPAGSGILPGQGGVPGVSVSGLGAGRALEQPDGLAAGDVNGRQQDQGIGAGRARAGRAGSNSHWMDSSQLASSAAPASPDFSGWNWVADSGPFSTAAMNGSPCVAQVISGAVIRSLLGSGSDVAA